MPEELQANLDDLFSDDPEPAVAPEAATAAQGAFDTGAAPKRRGRPRKTAWAADPVAAEFKAEPRNLGVPCQCCGAAVGVACADDAVSRAWGSHSVRAEDAKAAVPASVETKTAEEYSAQGFTDEDIELLREAGLVSETQLSAGWMPTTLDDVDWIAWHLHDIEEQIAQINARANVRLQRLHTAHERFLERFGDAARDITLANLPRRKDGTFARKSLDLDRVRVKITSRAGGPRVAVPQATLDYILRCYAEDRPLPEELAAAARAHYTVHATGPDALAMLRDNQLSTGTVRVEPIKHYVEQHPETEIPGVEIVPPSDDWSFEVSK